jgi:hypothetical protein
MWACSGEQAPGCRLQEHRDVSEGDECVPRAGHWTDPRQRHSRLSDRPRLHLLVLAATPAVRIYIDVDMQEGRGSLFMILGRLAVFFNAGTSQVHINHVDIEGDFGHGD